MDVINLTVLLVVLLTLIQYVEPKKHKINLKGFDTSVILHALVSDDESSSTDISDATLSDSISPIKGLAEIYKSQEVDDGNTGTIKSSDKHKNKKRHHKDNKKHKKRNNKGKKKSKQSKTCCENGGLCVLGSFCHCPKNFVGRYCEYEVKTRDCGPVKHEEIFRQGCTLCRCLDGILNCIPQMYANCDDDQVEPIFFDFNQVSKSKDLNTKLIVSADDKIKSFISRGENDDEKAEEILHSLEKMASSGASSMAFSVNNITSYISVILLTMLLQRVY